MMISTKSKNKLHKQMAVAFSKVDSNNLDDTKGKFDSLLKRNIAIIGGGWYGCHLGTVLSKSGHNVTVFERNSGLMMGSSGYNTFRLHLGPHYPRCADTRKQVNESFKEFILRYPEFVINQSKAFYAIGDKDSDGNCSMVNAEEFRKVCDETDPSFIVEEAEKYGFSNIEILCSVNEKTISVDKPAPYFEAKLKDFGATLKFNCTVSSLKERENGHVLVEFEEMDAKEKIKKTAEFDWCINCTYFTDFTNLNSKISNVFYQPCVSFYYKPKLPSLATELISLSIFDGKFPSLDPYVTTRHGNLGPLYILTHAKYTPLGKCSSYNEATKFLQDVKNEKIDENRGFVENEFLRFYPNFYDHFEYEGYFLSTKTKIESNTDFRGTEVWKEDNKNIIHVFSGKISTIFQAEEEVSNIIKSSLNFLKCKTNSFAEGE